MKFAKARKLVDERINNWGSYGRNQQLNKVSATLPAGTVLECDRVYIRIFSKSALQVGNDFDSITWKVMKGEKPEPNQRFWAKLPDCYTIEYEIEADGLYRDRVKAIKSIHES